ncbi:beta-ketoacyl synthase N-terminal-like domain-containing protein [Haloferula sp. BvORR071]|uniref:beta-ketoacyl synthase N-terminal-like domain-containing protein n=1 Tax=Haloferula sp. BvORR071 TaxID=1396141 RepID=UPI000552F3ED|nr:beta-ketoacyl synthase N-terminal-like domain-containing protein [Haloferula sp. BvORR071]
MTKITITGTGAVTPAGWGVEPFMQALDAGTPLATADLVRERKDAAAVVTPVLRVPPAPPTLPKSPRLRRVSPVSKFAVAAAIEALGEERIAKVASGELRLGILCPLMNGCVNYSNRFFGEVLADPTVASPILFPETVFNAPSSHLSSLFNSTAPNDTLLGDTAEIYTALEIATEWLLRGDCDGVLVVAPEELDWLSSEALRLYASEAIPAEGAAALYLELDGDGPQLLSVPDPIALAPGCNRASALKQLLGACAATTDSTTLLADSRNGVSRLDHAEDEAYANWQGPQLSVRRTLGESFTASSGLQIVAAVQKLVRGDASRALIATLGGNEQAAGCVIQRG